MFSTLVHVVLALAAEESAAGEPASPPVVVDLAAGRIERRPVERNRDGWRHACAEDEPWMCIPGNEYPRKHTVYLNFSGGQLLTGDDNSAESTSPLAREGAPYPAFYSGEQAALAVADAVERDMAPYGIRVMYRERPPQILPYTMVMVGGSWNDVNNGSPAGGIAPVTDCGARNQRHIVYAFEDGQSSTFIANIASQEAGHAWGLDHSSDCYSVMAYCGGGDKAFFSGCRALCGSGCGDGTSGCGNTHGRFCAPGEQDEHAELGFIFGGGEPDQEAPYVEILEPEHGATYDEGASVDIVVDVDDDFGGFGWRFVVEHDRETVFDEVDYHGLTVNEDFLPNVRLKNAPVGQYDITVIALDHADHETVETVRIGVGEAPEPGDDGDDGADGSGDDGGDDGGDGDGGGGDGGDGGGGGDAADDGGGVDEGCGCAVPTGRGGGLGMLAVVIAARRRVTRSGA